MTIVSSQRGEPLLDWAGRHKPAESMSWKQGYWDQINFVLDLVPLLAKNDEERAAISNGMCVISMHISKSLILPVFRVELPDGTAFTMRYNFFNWKISVDSPRDVDADFMGLFDPEERIPDFYCEGFPRELVYGPYSMDKRQFTIELANRGQVYVFFWVFAHHVLGNRNKERSGR